MKYSEIAAINVNEHVEKKQNLSYLSWAWAVDQLMRLDENAKWEYQPHQMFGDTMMVFCTVTAFGRSRTSQLPVMDHRNKAIVNPDSFQVNVAMQRCLAKAIALQGLGLYIYSGEDLPVDDGKKEEPKDEPKKVEAKKSEAVPAVISGEDAAWQIKISTQSDNKDEWVATVIASAQLALDMAESRKDVLTIYRVNKVIIEKLSSVSVKDHKDLMAKFGEFKTKFTEEK